MEVDCPGAPPSARGHVTSSTGQPSQNARAQASEASPASSTANMSAAGVRQEDWHNLVPAVSTLFSKNNSNFLIFMYFISLAFRACFWIFPSRMHHGSQLYGERKLGENPHPSVGCCKTLPFKPSWSWPHCDHIHERPREHCTVWADWLPRLWRLPHVWKIHFHPVLKCSSWSYVK